MLKANVAQKQHRFLCDKLYADQQPIEERASSKSYHLPRDMYHDR